MDSKKESEKKNNRFPVGNDGYPPPVLYNPPIDGGLLSSDISCSKLLPMYSTPAPAGLHCLSETLTSFSKKYYSVLPGTVFIKFAA